MRDAWCDEVSEEKEDADEAGNGVGEIEFMDENDAMGLSNPRRCVCEDARVFSASTTVANADLLVQKAKNKLRIRDRPLFTDGGDVERWAATDIFALGK